jgi:endonuclease I
MKKTTLLNATLTMEQAFNELVDPSPTKGELKAAITFFKNSCAYCGEQLTKTHWDHVIPASQRGTNQIRNRVPSCDQCNSKKGNRPWMEFVGEKKKRRKEAINDWIKKWGTPRQPSNGDIAILRRELAGQIASFTDFYERAQKVISDQHSQKLPIHRSQNRPKHR